MASNFITQTELKLLNPLDFRIHNIDIKTRELVERSNAQVLKLKE